MLKFAPTAAEIEEGVAFYGRAGNALMKSFTRLGIDPLAIYGTLCVKCPVSEPSLAGAECIDRVVEEIAIVQPRIIVLMGDRTLASLNQIDLPLAASLEATFGEVQSYTPTIDALLVPDIDESLDSEDSKRDVLVRVPVARRLVRRPAALLGRRRRGLGDGDHRPRRCAEARPRTTVMSRAS